MELRQKKTGRMLYLPLNKQAQAYLPHTKRSAEDYVFSLPCTSTIDLQLKKWAQNAGINKKLTYHMRSHSKFFYLLNISELSILKNVTANDLETSYILFLSQLCNIQRTL